jgi:PHP family Zn ribbon phosphoesterase
MPDLDFFCSRCFKPYTLPEEEKETFKCRCGGHMVGIGICKPRNYEDEFSERRRTSTIY